MWLVVIGLFHRWLLQLPARWRGRARLPRGQLRRETVSWLHYTGVQAVGVLCPLFYPSTTAALSSKEKNIWVNSTSYNRSRALAPVGQHRCQGSPWPARAKGHWLSQEGVLPFCPRGQGGAYHFAPPGSQRPLARTGKIGRPPPGSQHPWAGAGQGLPWHLCWPTGANARLRLYNVR